MKNSSKSVGFPTPQKHIDTTLSNYTAKQLETALAEAKRREREGYTNARKKQLDGFIADFKKLTHLTPELARCFYAITFDGTVLPGFPEAPEDRAVALDLEAYLGEHAKTACDIIERFDKTLTDGRRLLLPDKRSLVSIIASALWSAEHHGVNGKKPA